jgi:polyisoprenoid-binding protein YceI
MANWIIDNTHSEVGFSVKHLMISTVKGNFADYNAIITSQGDGFANLNIQFEAAVDSINTHNEQRDGHLKSPDFFDALTHPKITFKAEGANAEKGKLSGMLTIRGTSRLVEFDVEFAGTAVDPYGNFKAGFTISGKINRKDFGLSWSAVTEAGGVVVSDEVKIHADVQLVKQ